MPVKNKTLDSLLDRPIAFQPVFKRITGSTVAAIMLSQAWYWSSRTKNPDGWFYKSGIEWEDETGLSRSEQETARRINKAKGVMDEVLLGVPATMHYRVLKDRVWELLGVQFAETLQTEYAGSQQTGMPGSSKPVSPIPANIKEEPETTHGTTQGLPVAADEKVSWLSKKYTECIGLIPNIQVADSIKEYSVYPQDWLEYGFRELAAARKNKSVRNAWPYVQACVRTCENHGGVPSPNQQGRIAGTLSALANS